jgi:cell fate regulator YaaT (PSP1 superfamily)
MDYPEYLVSYGSAGEFGRFRPVSAVTCARGDRVVVRSHRGVELGELLCRATPGHAHFLPNTSVGQLLRPATPEDERQAERGRERGQALFADARRLATELGLPLEVVDVEVLLDGEQAIVHHLPWAEFDERDLVSVLVREHGLRVRLHSLRTVPEAAAEEHGCGRPDCGRTEGGGCSTCGSGGGCSTCGAAKPEEVRAYFAALRGRMEQQSNRVPLL